MMTENDDDRRFTVGELAGMVGVTVRTLQYYDKNNLLNSSFTEGGRRTYARNDILKLQQILFLKSLGFSLDEIRGKILRYENSADLEKVFTEQRDILRRQIDSLAKIVKTLNTVISEMKTGQEISLERLMTILNLMKEGNPYTFIFRYFNDEQFKNLATRFDSSEKYRAFMDKSTRMFGRLDALYRRGADPEGPEGQDLAKQWWTMVNEFTAGNSDMLQTLISSGRDIDNWPEDSKEIQQSIKHFLSRALDIYLEKNGISITKTKQR